MFEAVGRLVFLPAVVFCSSAIERRQAAATSVQNQIASAVASAFVWRRFDVTRNRKSFSLKFDIEKRVYKHKTKKPLARVFSTFTFDRKLPLAVRQALAL